MSAELTAAVEHFSGRRVLAFLSANHVDPDLAVESFVLVPGEDDSESVVAHGDSVAAAS
jgi:hypothetical protein